MKKSFTGTKGTILIIVLCCLVVSYYYHLSNKTNSNKHEEEIKVSAASDLLLHNYDINYPPTPKEVLKEYLQITKVLHNDSLTDDEINQLAKHIQKLYDEEFLANKSEEDYLKDLKSEVATFRENDYSITNYYTTSSTDVIYDVVDGYQFAKMFATYSIRTTGKADTLQMTFILRKDDAGHWKIYGWQPVMEEDE